MKEYRTAAAGDARGGVVINLDDEIIEMIVPREPVAAILATELDRLIVVAARQVFAPGVLATDGANGQEGPRPRCAVGPPPQLPWPESAFWGPSIALALVGDDSTPPQGDRDRMVASHEPTAARVTGCRMDPNRRQRPVAAGF